MKTFLRITVMAAIVLSAGACQREAEIFPDGQTLTAEIVNGSPDTRTAYDETDADSFVWESGDQIAVFLSDNDTYNKYRLIDLEPYGDGTRAKFLCSTTSELKRRYYAVYPAEARVDAEYGQSGHPLQVTLKNTYDIRDNLSTTVGSDGIRPSDRVPLVLVADNAYDRTVGTGEANLQFHHVGGLLRITLTEVPSTTQRIQVTMDHNVTGSFTVSFDGDGIPSISTSGSPSGGRNIVTFQVADSGSSIGSGVSTVILNLPVPCATYNTVSVDMLNSSGTSVATKTFSRTMTFDRRHGKKLGLQELTYSVSVAGAISDISRTGATAVQYYGQDVTVNVRRNEGAGTAPSPWKAYFHTANVAAGTAVSSSWSDTPLKAGSVDWLSLSQYEGDGDANLVRVSMAEVPLSSGTISGTSAVEQRDSLRAGSGVRDLDLSTYDFLDGLSGKSCETANCYVIKTYGSYLIPCIYGNAFQGESAYKTSVTGTGGAAVLQNFVNADGNPIHNPVIPEDISHGELCARVVWQDVLPGYEMLTDGDLEYVSTPGTAANCPYIRVNFRRDRILTGNIVIALYDRTNSKILWSWHLWVTSRPFKMVRVTQVDDTHYVNVLNMNLGWTPPIKFSAGSASVSRNQYVIIVSVADGKAVDCFQVNQSGSYSAPATTNPTAFSNTFYQFGRKDPFLPGDGSGKNRPVSFGDGFNGTGSSDTKIATISFGESVSATARLAQFIQYPYKFFDGYTQEPKYVNRWSINLNAYNKSVPVRKTIYDPSPRGFKVPHGEAFTGFTLNGLISNENGSAPYGKYIAASGEMPAGWLMSTNHQAPPAEGNGTCILYFPMVGYRYPTLHASGNPTAGQLESVNGYGNYYSASPLRDDHTVRNMTLHGSYISPLHPNYSTDGRCVRPIYQWDYNGATYTF